MSPSQRLRNVIFKMYETLSAEYRKKYTFDELYESEIEKVINEYKNNI